MIGQTLSRFTILDKLGEGGMGVVYRAEDLRLRRTVALKVLRPELVADAERRRRFLNEARASAAVSHPSIATLHEIGEDQGLHFLVMEYVPGQTLRSRIGGRPLPLRSVMTLGLQVAEGLCHAHQAGVIHRDLKPNNIMVGPEGKVKILDFGLAKLLEPAEDPSPSEMARLETISREVTTAKWLLGTPAYMSPEQLRGEPADRRSDLFAFGVMLYEMVTAASPFVRATSIETSTAILHDAPVAARQRNAEIPAELERIVSKCLEKDRNDRYQDCRDLLVDLRRLKRELESRPAIAQLGAPSAQAPTRSLHARRLLWSGAGVLMISALLGAGWVVWQPVDYREPGAPRAQAPPVEPDRVVRARDPSQEGAAGSPMHGAQSATAGASAPGVVKAERVALRTRDGFYVRAARGGGDDVVADVKEPETSALFTLEWLDEGKSQVRLRTSNDYYVRALEGGGSAVDARVNEPRTSAVFTLRWFNKGGGSARFRTVGGFYLHAVNGGGGSVNADVEEPGSSEVFTLIRSSR